MDRDTSINTSASQVVDSDYPYGKRYAYSILFLFGLLWLFDLALRLVVSSLFSDMNRDLGITPSQFGLLTGIVSFAISLLVFPVSILEDRWSRKKTVAIMAIIWAIASLLCAFSGQFWQLLLLRFLVGAGEAGYGPGASTIVQDAFPPQKHNTVLGILQACGPIGAIAGMILGGIIVQYLGWRWAFGLVAIPCIPAAFMVLFIKEPVRQAVTKINKNTGIEEKVPFGQIMKKILTTRTLLFLYCGMSLVLIFYSCVVLWVPSFFRYTEGLSQQAAGIKGAGVMLTSALGAVLGGSLGDRLSKIKPSLPLVFAGIAMFITCAAFLLGFLYVPQGWRYPCMLVGGLFLSSQLGIAYATVLRVSHKGIQATALGSLILVQNLFGATVGASISGFIAEYYGKVFMQMETYKTLAIQNASAAHDAMMAYSIQHAILAMSFMTILSGISFILASRYYDKDCAGAECFA